MKFIISSILLFLFTFNFYLPIQAQQETKRWSLNGYISNMQSVMFDSIKNQWFTDNLIHNRLNFSWFPNEHITFNLQMRNRFLFGDQIKLNLIDKKSFGKDAGFIPYLTNNIDTGNSYILNSSFDRANIKLTFSKIEVTFGRQRINWGQNFVWNPNDIFNIYSFFDFDYVERPGSDAVRIQYYTGNTSSVELAMKLDSAKKITLAGLGRFNIHGYDIQIIGGLMNDEDLVIGTGWTGNIGPIGFSGEFSYLYPKENIIDTSGYLIGGIGFNYSFSNSLFLQFEGLYNNYAKKINAGSFLQFYTGPLSVKNISISEFSFFGQISYPFNPLINGLFTGMFMPDINGFFIGPSIDFSLTSNLSFSLLTQVFSGKFKDMTTGIEKRQWFNLGFLRLKYSF